MYKRFISMLTVAVLFAILSAFFAAADTGVEFCLSDVNTDKNRLFETTFSAKGGVEISAFVVNICYDSSCVQFRKATVTGKGQMSVNDSESGKIRIAYLCEEPVDCKNKGDFMVLEFKSADKDCNIDFDVQQVIDKNAKPVKVSKEISAFVKVDNKEKADASDKENSADSEKDNANDTGLSESVVTDNSAYNTEKEQNHLVIESDDGGNLVVLCATGVLFLVAGVGAVAFIAGRKTWVHKKNSLDIGGKSDEKDT